MHQDLHEVLRVHLHQLLLEVQHEVQRQRGAVLEQQQQHPQRERLQQLRLLHLQLLRGQLRRVRGLERGEEGDCELSRPYFVDQGGNIKLLFFQDATCSITSTYQASYFEKRTTNYYSKCNMKYDANPAPCFNNSNSSANENAYSNYVFYASNSYGVSCCEYEVSNEERKAIVSYLGPTSSTRVATSSSCSSRAPRAPSPTPSRSATSRRGPACRSRTRRSSSSRRTA